MQDGNANVFTWSVENATRYELIGSLGKVLYSGTGNRWAIPYGMNHVYIGWPWVFKAYNGPNADSPVMIINYHPNLQEVNTPDPSG